MKELWLPNDYATNYEIKNRKENNENGLRVYCTGYPDNFTVQIRTFKPINEFHNGKPRNMIANILLTKKQLHQICDFADNFTL